LAARPAVNLIHTGRRGQRFVEGVQSPAIRSLVPCILFCLEKILSKRLSIALSAAAVALVASSARASTNYVQNGSFESVSGLTASFSLETPTSDETKVANWSLGNTSALTTNQVLNCLVMGGTNTNVCGTVEFGGGFSYWVNPGESPDGGNYFAADGDSSADDTGAGGVGVNGGYSVPIYQSIAGLTIGQQYTISFYQAAAQQNVKSGATTEQWEVEFCTTLPTTLCNGSNVQLSPLMNDVSHGDIPWQSVSLNFTANATSEILEFIALGTPNGAPPFDLLDGVNMQATPEPATFALIGLGLLAVPFAARLRRKLARSAPRA
jgi:hypothetical protein